MAGDVSPLTLRVFLASPGDVPDERACVREFLESILPNDPWLPGRVTFRLVSWDHPHASATMPAHLTPQEAVIRYQGRPADCDIVLVILAGRLGTHLAAAALRRPDGTDCLSGTEWEYEDAWNAQPRPDILVYRRTDIPPLDMRDRDSDERLRQYRLVEQFLERFKNPDSSWRGGFQEYAGLDEFRAKLATDIKRLVVERLSRLSPPADQTPAGVPVVPPARCFGRDPDVATLAAALAAPDAAALLVLGSAGIGKTTLTRQAATDAAVMTRFGPRRWFVELETAADAAAMRAAIVQATGHNPAAVGFAQLLPLLARSPCLLVLDNLETPWERDQRAVQAALQALAATPGVSLLASLRGGAAPPVPRWTRPPVTLRPLPPDEARRLFLELAPGIANDDPHLPEFLAALGGVPLAVELVALRAAADASLRELWAEWQQRGLVLAAHPDLPPEHRLTSVTRSLDLSWRSPRLREAGQRLFRLLGQLPAGIAAEDRAALLGDAASEAARQLRAVGLAYEGDGRLDLLPPVRGYALAATPPEPEDMDGLWRHYLERAKALGDCAGSADSGALIEALKPEVANLEAALASSVGGGRRPAAVAAVRGYAVLLRSSGLGRAAPIEALAAACAQTGDQSGAARCQENLGDIALDRSDHAAARDAYQQALSLFRQVGDVRGEANCIFSLGDIARARSDHAAARDAYQQALPLYRQVGQVLGEANCIFSLGDIALERSDHDAARDAYQQALPLFHQVGQVLGEANCIKRLGDIALERSDHDAARDAYQQALPLYRQVGSVLGEANCIRRLGEIALERSDHAAAHDAYRQALPLYRQVGDVLGEANCIQSLGDIGLARFDHAAARDAYRQALPLYRQVGDVLGEANCIQRLGDIALARSDQDAAQAGYLEALVLYQRIAEPYSIGFTHRRLATISADAERDAHISAAREAWASIDRDDLIAQYLDPPG
jgi:tetratricopeptide (TPR) repeat protein